MKAQPDSEVVSHTANIQHCVCFILNLPLLLKSHPADVHLLQRLYQCNNYMQRSQKMQCRLLSSANNLPVSDQYNLLLQRILGNSSHKNMLLCIMRNASGCSTTSWKLFLAQYAMEHRASFVSGRLGLSPVSGRVSERVCSQKYNQTGIHQRCPRRRPLIPFINISIAEEQKS